MTSIVQLNNLFTEFYDKFASWEQSVVRESNYSLAQIHTLEVLGSCGAMKMKDLAVRLGITTGTLTVQVDKLVKASLIERIYSQEDRRTILVDLTDKGKAVFEHHNHLHLTFTEELLKGVDQKEEELLIQILNKVNNNF
ncbi:MarR family winged helix-turn-helix transcriptional regulator [Vibrio salinus]|uniref:MarR family winged helix-turn-helix transcriptional regulator n=1 Tax=Vibrio salinus TaxID=2899784 RepID=UPI001E3D1FAB|nr:MarR family transcriptional regulator [Vibrio salinus]MCE0495108.1 MarR family transcriptional regulator [Vibrio salinus]